MNAFRSLFRTLRPMIGDRLSPDTRRQLFPEVVKQSRRFHLWRPGDPFPEIARRLLIGVATWNGSDMVLLDMIEESNDASGPAPLQIDVFDLDSCRNPDEIQKIIPGIGLVTQSPAVGYWIDGSLKEKGTGHTGRYLITTLCDLDPIELQNRMDNLNKRTG